jgi:arylsulfatase
MGLRRAISGVAMVAALVGGIPVGAEAPAAALAPASQRDSKPNVLIWVLDDIGFAQLSAFGGLVPTPNIDRVAQMGLRYTNYHTPPICSAARAALLTGRNSHSVHVGGHIAVARDYPGYDGNMPAGAGTIAENFRQAGYATFALGKWDDVPLSESTPAGPMTHWPLRQGFDRFYGFMAAETDNFDPLLWEGNSPRNRPAGDDYHLSADLADRAIAMIDARNGADPAAPFLMYWATGVAHAPHHAPADWIARFKGKFDMGWDKARELILKKQKAAGLVPKHTRLAPRPAQLPAWDSLSGDERRLYARQMEVFAAALAHADAQFGRILDAIERRGELDNTIVVIVSDNGASAEGGPSGSYHELLFTRDGVPDAAGNMPFLDRWGSPATYPHYAMGWAVAGNTPYRNYKQTTYEGGIHVPLIVAWPKGIAARGELRDQFVHAADITPTLLAAAGVTPAETVNDTRQLPFEGQDFRYSFTATAPAPAAAPRGQYFEMFGHKGLWADGWKIVSYSKLETWDMNGPGRIDRPWELYNLAKDPGESEDLAARLPAKLAQLDAMFDAQARKFNVYPIADQAMMNRELMPKLAADFARRKGEWSYPGPVSRLVGLNVPPLARGAFTMRAQVTIGGAVSGPIFAHGGRMGGAGLYLDAGKPVFVVRAMTGEPQFFAATQALPSGTHGIELDVHPAEGGAHLVTIRADGQVLLSREGHFRIPGGPGETFEIGRDDGSAVGESYVPGKDFPGEIRNVVFSLH